MDGASAHRVIESLRKGIPPDGFIRHFTVGREDEIAQLLERLDDKVPGAVLLKANYGSGKTHLLRLIREYALDLGFAVSSVTLDACGAVRFNRMDQVFGAICRSIELPGCHGQTGIRPLFDFIVDRLERAKSKSATPFWLGLSHKWKWDYSEVLDSPAMFLAVRAWATGDPDARDRVEDWLLNPWHYRSQRKLIYSDLVDSLRRHFIDPRPDWQFYSDGVFDFHTHGYTQSWSALRDLRRLVCEAGLKGLVLLFDEFEDVITNLKNVAHREAAFWNLFQFYGGRQFPGLSFYAVTPEFVQKCADSLINHGRWDYDFERFATIPTFQMSPLEVEELEKLAFRILKTHGVAFGWEPDVVMRAAEFRDIVREAASFQIQDRARHTITTVVRALDRLLEENE